MRYILFVDLYLLYIRLQEDRIFVRIYEILGRLTGLTFIANFHSFRHRI